MTAASPRKSLEKNPRREARPGRDVNSVNSAKCRQAPVGNKGWLRLHAGVFHRRANLKKSRPSKCVTSPASPFGEGT